MAHPGGDVPVDGPEVVALLIGADFGELESLAPKHRAVLAAEQGIHQRAGAELDAFDLAQHLRRHGTSTASSTRAITSSASRSSACASNDSSTRCRRTSGATAFTSSGTT